MNTTKVRGQRPEVGRRRSEYGRRLAAWFCFCILHSAFCLRAPAQGTAFTYQGRLNDGGAAASGIYDLRFTIYDLGTNGTIIAGPLTNASTIVSNGLFTVALDFGSGVFTGPDRWLEIGARTNGVVSFTTLTGRQAIKPAPYAMFANTASNLSGVLGNSSLPSGPNFSGTVTAAAFSGSGSNLTLLDAGNISSGTLADARLSTNVALRAGGNTFSGIQTYYGPIYMNTPDGYDQSSIGNFLIDAPYIPGGRFAVMTNGYVGVANPNPQFTLDVNGPLNLASPATIYSSGSWMLRADSYGNFFGGVLAGNLTLSSYYNVGIGYGALYSDTSGGNNTAIGALALVSNSTGTNNTASGFQALHGNINGVGNTADGYQALYSNTNGPANTANGSQALYSNLNGKENTANGYAALYSNTTGSDNTANGTAALYSNTTGANNAANGAGALYSNTTGGQNVANGYAALYSNANGFSNTANGNQALYSNTSGDYNTASGDSALYHNTIGVGNTADGFQALYSNTSGLDNSATGYKALYGNTGGIRNVADGEFAMYSNTSGSNNAAVGYTALYSNTTGTGNTAEGYQALYYNNAGTRNVAVGEFAMYINATGSNNTAVGDSALYSNINGTGNTAEGYQALFLNDFGYGNVANGYQALYSNTFGLDNTAEGYQALFSNGLGLENVADGYLALYANTNGGENTAVGCQALCTNANGGYNAAIGYSALRSNVSGSENSGLGTYALGSNLTGDNNTASGFSALAFNTTGSNNTANGYLALYSSQSGHDNISMGYRSGFNITTGSSNIDIGSQAVLGDNNTIRIGSAQGATFIAGIYNVSASGGIPVYVNPSGQLGTTPSSRRFKQRIQTMGDASDVLLSLRPVSFQYKPEVDPAGLPQFGLIAEEVEKIDPELVVHDQEHGIYTVRYEAVNAMLLNEFLKEHKTVSEQTADIRGLSQKLDEKETEITDLKQRLAKLEQLMNTKIGGAP